MQNLADANPLTVSQLNREARDLLESGIGRLWVEGELSGIRRPGSGHLYFRLKDGKAQIAAAFFRGRQRGPTIGFKEGDQVLAYGQVSLYEARGDYQLIVERIEPAGEGLLKRQYERLKNKLAEEGLFDETLKQDLPVLPRRIGVITSPSGAALRDMLTVLRRRFPSVPVVIYPASVQGDKAPAELLAALELANQRDECDVLVIGRGGGSMEDLWCFNDEALARGIAASAIPVVSAIGHEVDFTIADFVADVRAPTPSAAAELIVPDSADWLERLSGLARRLDKQQRRQLEDIGQSLDWLQRRLFTASPSARLERQRDATREYSRRLAARLRELLLQRKQSLGSARSGLLEQSPMLALGRLEGRLDTMFQRLNSRTETLLSDKQHRLQLAARALNSVSPLATLQRGYAIVLDAESGKALVDADDVKAGQSIEARLASGRLKATVDEVLK